ncbi:uncharacterized protein [Atheta coriaria]|uniref:uncharacterized protein n=1 Tax=Dalotia coriaria TaxID=877792 RepID=UPI0031F451CD
MTIKEGLLQLLNNNDEPLPKRLKIADNAFKCDEVRIEHRELFLLKWLAQTEISNNSLTSWQQCSSWLSSDTFRELKSPNFTNNDVKLFLQRVEEEFKCEDVEIHNVLITVVYSIVDCRIFQHYFRENLIEYIKFLQNILQNCGNSETLINLLARHEKLFGRRFTIIPDFYNLFIQELFPSFVQILIKFPITEGDRLFLRLSQIIQKNVFSKKQDEYSNILTKLWTNTDNEDLNTEILQVFLQLLQVSKKCNPTYVYHAHILLFNAFCRTFKQNSTVSYYFFVYLLQNLGFSSDKLNNSSNTSADFNLSLNGLIGLLEIIQMNNLKFDVKINDISFEDLIQKLLLCIISKTKSPIDTKCFEIIDLIIKISPLTIESIISPLLIYLMCSSKEKFATQYASVMCNVFDVFSKLHRLQNLISKIIRTLQPVYVDDDMTNHLESLELDDFDFIGKVSKSLKEEINAVEDYVELDVNEILPNAVLEKFSAGTVAMATKQMSNLFKTFTFHLDELIGQDLAEKSKKTSYVTFIEVINRLLCHYLENINLSGSFKIANVTEKLVKHLDETQSVLEKFGNSLVGIEHNQNLMRVFLQLSYVWGELKILVLHNGESLSEVKDSEVSSCNITCLHSYLPAQTWCLIAERISNFGEVLCKKIMEKLWIQKIRYLILSGMDTSAVNEHISTLVKTITPIEEYYEYLLSNEFAAHAILNRMDAKSLVSIADCVLKDATQNTAILKRVIESRHFVSALIYSMLRKMNKIFKKEAKQLNCEFISCALFTHFGENLLQEEINVEDMHLKDFFENANEASNNIDADKFAGYFTLIKQLPIVFIDKSIQNVLFYYLLGVFLDIKSTKQNGDAVNDLEQILLGLAQNRILVLDACLPAKLMLKTIITNFDKAQDLFILLIPSRHTDGSSFNKALDYLTEKKNLKDDKHIKCLLVLIKHLRKYKKSRELLQNVKTNLQQLCESLLPRIATSNETHSIYLEILIECLYNDKVPVDENIKTVLEEYLSKLFTQEVEISNGDLELFNFALTNEYLDDAKSTNEVFISNVAKSLLNVKITSNSVHVYASNIVNVLQKIQKTEIFNEFLTKLLQKAITSIDSPGDLALEMQVWHQILSSPMKTEKAEVFQKVIEELLVTLFNKLRAGDAGKENILNILIDLELNLLQNTQHLLTSTSLDLCFATITQRMHLLDNFELSYKRSMEMLEAMLKYRQALISDRLSVFLQEYRMLLSALCAHSDTANKQYDDKHFDKMAELAHALEKLTINLCKLREHVASVAIYLIADILKEFETIAIYPAVKLALNNCVYNLIALCNQHGISCLMRALSPGSTEMFKMAYDNYKKYHRFTGKV